MRQEMRYVDHGSGGGPEVLKLGQMAVPLPQSGEILLEVAFAGVNRPDCAQRIGRYPAPPGASPIIGLEVSGRVIAVGADVTQLSVGDAVCALTPGGGYAEYCIAPAAHCLPVPAGWTLEEAACLPEAMFTVWDNVFTRAQLKRGEVILVHGGSGGVGNAAIQLACAMGAEVLATVGSPEKGTRCLALGARHVINYVEQDFVQEVLGLTSGRGVDVVLDMVAGPYLARNLEALAMDGRIAVIAFMGGVRSEIEVIPILRKRATITGSTLRPRSLEYKSRIAKDLQRNVWPLLEQGKCKPFIFRTFELEDAAQAHRLMDSGTHFGKIVLRCVDQSESASGGPELSGGAWRKG